MVSNVGVQCTIYVYMVYRCMYRCTCHTHVHIHTCTYAMVFLVSFLKSMMASLGTTVTYTMPCMYMYYTACIQLCMYMYVLLHTCMDNMYTCHIHTDTCTCTYVYMEKAIYTYTDISRMCKGKVKTHAYAQSHM